MSLIQHSIIQVTQIVRFLLERGLRFRNLQVGFGGHDSNLMWVYSDLQCTCVVTTVTAACRWYLPPQSLPVPVPAPAAARGPARGCATPGGLGHGTRSGGGPPGPELEPRRPGRRLGVELSGRWHARSGPGPSESHLLVSGSLALRLAVTGRSGRIYYRPKSRTMGATRQLQVGRLRSIIIQSAADTRSALRWQEESLVTAATSSCACNLTHISRA